MRSRCGRWSGKICEVLGSFRGVSCALVVAAVLGLGSAASAEQVASDTASAAAGEHSRLKPRKQRQLGKAERPTVKQQTATKASNKRWTHVTVQLAAAQ